MCSVAHEKAPPIGEPPRNAFVHDEMRGPPEIGDAGADADSTVEERAHLGELGRIFLVDVGRVGVEIDEGDPMVFGKGSQQNEALVAREYHRLLGLVRQARADIGRDIAAGVGVSAKGVVH